jgi:hypothetical protein
LQQKGNNFEYSIEERLYSEVKGYKMEQKVLNDLRHIRVMQKEMSDNRNVCNLQIPVLLAACAMVLENNHVSSPLVSGATSGERLDGLIDATAVVHESVAEEDVKRKAQGAPSESCLIYDASWRNSQLKGSVKGRSPSYGAV